jgi:hypothetical protein
MGGGEGRDEVRLEVGGGGQVRLRAEEGCGLVGMWGGSGDKGGEIG